MYFSDFYEPEDISMADVDYLNYSSRFMDNFTAMNTLGKGGYGIVLKAVSKDDGREYAVKRVRLPNR